MNIQNKKFKIQNFSLRTPHSALRTHLSSSGFTYIALLAAIVIIGISLGAAGKYWSNVIQREKEQELLFRGEQYWKAIALYYRSAITGTQGAYPPGIEELLKDNRTAAGKRHLRQKYKDPLTGEDFIVIRQKGTRRIVGVRSASDKEPLKQGNFPISEDVERNTLYQKFEGKKKYSEWRFIYIAPGQAEPQTEDEVVDSKH